MCMAYMVPNGIRVCKMGLRRLLRRAEDISALLLRGAIVYTGRTYGTVKRYTRYIYIYIHLFLLAIFGPFCYGPR